MRSGRLWGVCLVVLLLAVAAAPAYATSNGVMAWGGGEAFNFGVLGNGTRNASQAPLKVPGLTNVKSVSSGFGQTLALLNNNTVIAWGSNQTGELGIGTAPDKCDTEECSKTPVEVGGLTGVTEVAAGSYHSLALLSNGTVMAWGDDAHGQLGPEEVSETCPFGTMLVACSRTPVPVSGLTGVIAIAAGYQTSLALLSNGTVVAWGENEAGELGNGSTTDSNVPVEVTGVEGAVAITAGYAESMALLSNGTVMAWGGNGHGQLGQEEHPATGPSVCEPSGEPCSTTPVAVKGLSEVTAISAGYWNAAALLANGTVMTWGSNATGQLGVGLTEGPETCPFPKEPCSSTPTVVPGLSNVSSIVASKDTEVLALRKDGTVMAWGVGSGGELGNGAHSGSEHCKIIFYCSTSPTPVIGIVDAVGIAAGAESGLAVLPTTEAPEFGRCLKVATSGQYEGGRYENSTCTKTGTEKKFEWYPGVAKSGFTATGGVSTLESVIGIKVVCQTEAAVGEYTGRHTVGNLVIRFKTCGFPETSCTSEGAAEGEIVSSELEGVLGVEKASAEGHIKDKIGLDYFPATGGAPFAEFQCETSHITIGGSVIGPVDSNTMALSPKRNFNQLKGKQKPERFEGGPLAVLGESFNGIEFWQAGLSLESVQTNEEKVEIRSIN
jgi:alpha-tubulin suppressor-like RCC1 family protein